MKLKALALARGVWSIHFLSLMDGDTSNRASSFPWIWVIEAFASLKQGDVSALHGSLNPIQQKQFPIVYMSNNLFNQSWFLCFRFD